MKLRVTTNEMLIIAIMNLMIVGGVITDMSTMIVAMAL